MPGRLIELVVRAHRQLGGELTEFSFRLAFVIDLAYIGARSIRRRGPGPRPAPLAPTARPAPAACVPPRPSQPVARRWPVLAFTCSHMGTVALRGRNLFIWTRR